MTDVERLQAEALFCSDVQPSDEPSWVEVRDVVHHMVFLHGERWCAERVAQEFGDHPEAAAARMRWCRLAVERVFMPVRV